MWQGLPTASCRAVVVPSCHELLLSSYTPWPCRSLSCISSPLGAGQHTQFTHDAPAWYCTTRFTAPHRIHHTPARAHLAAYVACLGQTAHGMRATGQTAQQVHSGKSSSFFQRYYWSRCLTLRLPGNTSRHTWLQR